MKVVLSGGPHAGKTSLVRELGRRGHRVVSEAAIDCIDDLVAQFGSEGARTWSRTHLDEFQERIAVRQLELERAAAERPGGLCFLDRGLLDGLAYCRIADQAPPATLLANLPHARYDAVVVCELVLPFHARTETGRMSSEERARRIERTVHDLYVEQGFRVVRLPFIAPLAARADLLLERLGGGAFTRRA